MLNRCCREAYVLQVLWYTHNFSNFRKPVVTASEPGPRQKLCGNICVNIKSWHKQFIKLHTRLHRIFHEVSFQHAAHSIIKLFALSIVAQHGKQDDVHSGGIYA